MSEKAIKIGTRGSPLALKQAAMFCAALRGAHPDVQTETVVIKTSGDWKPADGETRLSEQEGGKGLFAKEIEQALLDGAVDCAVHSLKDMDSELPSGLALDHFLPREDARDAFICQNHESFMSLPQGAVVGTASVRRQALLLAKRPDLKVVPLRGNVQTRLDKLEEGLADATLLAMAGLKRLGIESEMITPIEIDDMLPACGQGIVTIETRVEDTALRTLLEPVNCPQTALCAAAERTVLKTLDGSCHTPIGAYATFENGEIHLRALVASLDGQGVFKEEGRARTKDINTAMKLGSDIGAMLRGKAPKEMLT